MYFAVRFPGPDGPRILGARFLPTTNTKTQALALTPKLITHGIGLASAQYVSSNETGKKRGAGGSYDAESLLLLLLLPVSPSGQVQSGKFETIFSFSRALFEV